MSKFKLGDRVYFAYAGANGKQKGFGTVVGEGTDTDDNCIYYVHKDGEAPYESVPHEAWLIEQYYGDFIEHEEVYNSPLYKALS